VNWPLGTPYEYNGPTLMTTFIVYPPNANEEQVVAAYDATVKELAEKVCWFSLKWRGGVFR